MADEEREGILIGRIVIEKYATADDIEIYVDGFSGSGDDDDGLPLVDALGLLAFAQQHTWDSALGRDEDD